MIIPSKSYHNQGNRSNTHKATVVGMDDPNTLDGSAQQKGQAHTVLTAL